MARRTAGWRNTFQASDPELRRTLESISEWSGRVGAHVRVNMNVDQSIPTGGLFPTQMLLNNVIKDPYGFFDSANNRLVVPEGYDGVYSMSALATWDTSAAATHRRSLSIGNNAVGGLGAGGTIYGTSDQIWGLAAQFQRMPVTGIGLLRAGDPVYFCAYQTTGAPLAIKGVFGNEGCALQIARIGDYRDFA